MRIVITGGAGFLGKKLVGYLEEEGHTTYPLLMENENSGGLRNVLRGDITDPSTLSFPECDAVIHCAGILESSHPSDELMMKVNHTGTVNVFNEGVRKKMKIFVFISTISALGPHGSKDNPLKEDMTPSPEDTYGRSKLKAERFLEKVSEPKGISTTILRPSVLYGPGMNMNSSGMKTFTSIRKGIMPLVDGGMTTFNMLFVDNLLKAIELALSREGGTRIYHVSERPYAQKEVIEAIERRMGKKGHKAYPRALLWLVTLISMALSPIMKGPPPMSWTKYRALTSDIWTMSSERIRSELGYSEVKTLKEGVDITCSYYGW